VTHTIAQYTLDDHKDHYKADRLSQIWEISRFVRMTTSHLDDQHNSHSNSKHLVAILGDFNCTYEQLEYTTLMRVLGSEYIDSLEEFAKSQILDPSSLITMENEDKRLDYIFYKRSKFWKLTKSTVTMKGETHLISDHYGVDAEFQFLDGSATT